MEDQQKFRQTIKRLEEAITAAVKAGTLGIPKRIPTNENALGKEPFGIALGRSIDADIPYLIDYYGYLKPSNAMRREFCKIAKEDPPPRATVATVVHFASLHAEDMITLAPDLLRDFIELKPTMLRLRGFQKK